MGRAAVFFTMTDNVVAIAADHAGYGLKVRLADWLDENGYEVIDLGTDSSERSVDYPDFGRALADCISSGKAPRGLLVCGTGIGISIAANRNPAIRAATCGDATAARLAREHNDANVLAMGARVIGEAVAIDCLEVFLTTAFAGGRHIPRVAKLG